MTSEEKQESKVYALYNGASFVKGGAVPDRHDKNWEIVDIDEDGPVVLLRIKYKEELNQ